MKRAEQWALDVSILGAGRQCRCRSKVGNYRDALDRHVGAWDKFAEAAEAGSKCFVWGTPFFLGRRISVVQDGKAVPGSERIVGPLFAVK